LGAAVMIAPSLGIALSRAAAPGHQRLGGIGVGNV
jgi:hypothetical protein